MSSSSEAKTSSTTTTEQKDQRVSATDSAIAIGPGGTLEVNDQFSDNVLKAFERLTQIAVDAGITAKEFADKALTKVAERATTSETREQASTASLQRLIMFAGIGGIVWIALNSKIDLTKIFKR